ncbi:MAG: tyrosine-type recombinase/integrase [Streptosporangiaceae bacterium]
MTAPKPVTLGRAAEEYLASLATESTKRTYGAALKAMRARFGDDTALADITPQDVAAWLQQQWGGASSGTFNVRLRAVKSAAAWWAGQGWAEPGLVAGVEPRKSRAEQPAQVLTPAEIQALMARALGSTAPSEQSPTGIRNKALIMLLYRSGLRISEALSIRPGDIDHEARSIRVLKTKSGQPQTRYYHRTAEDALARWLDVRKGLGINGRAEAFCTTGGRGGSRPGRPLSRQYVAQMLKDSAGEAGIVKRVHPHGFRATFAAELENSGEPIEVICKLLGQSSVAVTARYLASLTNHQAGRALAAASLPDVGEGGQGEQTVEEQLAALRRELAELRKCKGEGQ